MDPAQDPFNFLPKKIIYAILSHLDLRFAVRCCVISKRWMQICGELPFVNLSPSSILGERGYEPSQKYKIERVISTFLTSHAAGDIRYFHLQNEAKSSWTFTPSKVCNWVEYAAMHNVKVLTLQNFVPTEYASLLPSQMMPSSLFLCTALDQLLLRNFKFNCVPSQFQGFRSLTVCCLFSVTFKRNSLAALISNMPVLKHLLLTDVVDDSNSLTISAPQLLSLTIERFSKHGVLRISCPKLLRISLKSLDVKVIIDKIPLHEFANTLLNATMEKNGDVIGLELGQLQPRPTMFSTTRFLGVLQCFTALKELKISSSEGFELIPINSLLQRLPNLEVLSLLHPSSGYKHTEYHNLQDCCNKLRIIDIQLEADDRKTSIPMLAYLLRSTPVLESMNIFLRSPLSSQYAIFIENLLHLTRASTIAKIIVLRK